MPPNDRHCLTSCWSADPELFRSPATRRHASDSDIPMPTQHHTNSFIGRMLRTTRSSRRPAATHEPAPFRNDSSVDQPLPERRPLLARAAAGPSDLDHSRVEKHEALRDGPGGARDLVFVSCLEALVAADAPLHPKEE